MSTSRPASRSRAAAVAPPAPEPTTMTSASNVRSPSSSAPTTTFGYATRCSGGTSRSAGAAMNQLGPSAHERLGAAGPVDVERREHVGMLVEGEEDERPEPEEQRRPQPAGVLEAREVGARLVRGHAREARESSCEQRWAELDQPEPGRQSDAQRPGKEGQERLDLAQHVVVHGLIESVPARPDRGDDGTQDAGARGGHGRRAP